MKQAKLLGAIAGDVIGSIYEFRHTKDYNFTLLHPRMAITDDSILTIAVADWVMNDPELSLTALIERLHHHG